MKKIWIINQYATLPTKFGSTRHYDLASSLQTYNYQITIIASGFSNFERRQSIKPSKSVYKKIKLTDRISFVAINTLSYNKNGLKRLLSSFFFAYRFKKIAKQLPPPDLIVGSSPELISSYQAFKVSRLLKIPFLLEIRDVWPETLVELGMKKYHPLVLYLSFLEKKLNLGSERIISVMPKYNRYAKSKFGINPKKITWVPNGIKDELVKRFAKPFSDRPFTVTYAGTIGRMQDIESIVFAAKLLEGYSDIKFKIYGEGVEKQNCIALAKSLDLKNITFLRPTAKNRLSEKLRLSNALILCLKGRPIYKYGCQPLKVPDYLAAGRPIIISAIAGTGSVENVPGCINLPPEDPDRIAEAVLKLYSTQPYQMKRLSQQNIIFLRQNFLISKLAKKLNKVISDLFEK
jgi:glycosyltransferase involved in cell wall biosynthesis